MKPGAQHFRCHCGTMTVTTFDALDRPRQRCPKCERVSMQLDDAFRASLRHADASAGEDPFMRWSASPVHNAGDLD